MKVELNPSYILHSRPYSETSLLLDVFSRDFGRVALLARGVRKKNSRRTSLLQPYQHLQIAWSGKSELMTLTDVESAGRPYSFSQRRLMSAFYLNELLIRLLHQGEAHPELFNFYDGSLVNLSNPQVNEGLIIRLFEKKILEITGYGLILDKDVVTGAEIKSDCRYFYQADRGASANKPDSNDYIEVSGETLLGLSREKIENEKSLQECKLFMRYLIKKQIGNKPIASRKLYESYLETCHIIDVYE